MKKKDLVEIYDDLWRQLKEDREKVVELYDSLKTKVNTTEDFAIHGLTLSKLAELLLKQTSQLIEIADINQKSAEEEENTDLDKDDRKSVYEMIGNKKSGT